MLLSKTLLLSAWLGCDVGVGVDATIAKQPERAPPVIIQYTNEGDRQRDRFVDAVAVALKAATSVEVIRLPDPTELTFRDSAVGFQEIVEKLPRGVGVNNQDMAFLMSLFEAKETYIFGSGSNLQVAEPFYPAYALLFRTTRPAAIFFMTGPGGSPDPTRQTGRGKFSVPEQNSTFEFPVTFAPASFRALKTKLDTVLQFKPRG